MDCFQRTVPPLNGDIWLAFDSQILLAALGILACIALTTIAYYWIIPVTEKIKNHWQILLGTLLLSLVVIIITKQILAFQYTGWLC